MSQGREGGKGGWRFTGCPGVTDRTQCVSLEGLALGTRARKFWCWTPSRPGPAWPLQVLGPKPALKEGSPEEDLTADQTNAQSAALYKVGAQDGAGWAGWEPVQCSWGPWG